MPLVVNIPAMSGAVIKDDLKALGFEGLTSSSAERATTETTTCSPDGVTSAGARETTHGLTTGGRARRGWVGGLEKKHGPGAKLGGWCVLVGHALTYAML